VLAAYDVGGKQVHDANVVATMLTHGITRLLTFNTGDFSRFADIITLGPTSEA
jgi:predicted nucleic acid-binding protein